jgi:hypothetical protein
MHAVDEELPAGENEFSGHVDTTPSEPLQLPAAVGVHGPPPFPEVPALQTQLLTSVLPVVLLDVPVGQLIHHASFIPLYFPAKQAVHWRFVVSNPALHRHAVCDELPVDWVSEPA